MLSLKKILTEDPQPSDGHSFGERFRAWWEGEALESGPESPGAGETGRLDEIRAGKPAPDVRERFPTFDRSSPWPDSRQTIAQLVWGEGFVAPHDAESTIEIVAAFELDSSSNMLEIGAGMGGGTRAIASQFGTYVSGWDLEPELAAEATSQAETHDLELKAAVKPLDPETVEFKAQFHAGVLLRETLYRIADKKAFLTKVIDTLKPGGNLVIVDLFFADDADASEMDRWRDGERSEAYGCEIGEAKELLTKLTMDVRAATDESDAYAARILDTWRDFVRIVGDEPLPDDLVLAMVDEAEFWARRYAAIRSGNLKLFRLACLKAQAIED